MRVGKAEERQFTQALDEWVTRPFRDHVLAPLHADIESGEDVRLADGTLARFVRTDVGSESDVQASVDSVLAREGQIDLLPDR